MATSPGESLERMEDMIVRAAETTGAHVRAAKAGIGTVIFGRQRDGSEKPAAMDLVRLAMPRRVCTQSHADYIVETFAEIAAAPERLKGYRIVWEPPALRHFTARFEPVEE